MSHLFEIMSKPHHLITGADRVYVYGFSLVVMFVAVLIYATGVYWLDWLKGRHRRYREEQRARNGTNYTD